MRHFRKLDIVTHDETSNTLKITSSADEALSFLWFGREGIYVSISAHYGPLEIALRPRHHDLVRSLTQLRPTDGLTVTRLVGTGQAHLELGLTDQGELIIRATIVADATGHVAMNTVLTSHVREILFQWLDINGAPAL